MDSLTFAEKLEAIKQLLVSTIGNDAGNELLLSIAKQEPEKTQPVVLTDESAGAQFENIIIFNGDSDLQPELNIGNIVTIEKNPSPIENIHPSVETNPPSIELHIPRKRQ